MKKILFTAAAVFAFSFANAQSNKKGTIHVNVLGGFSVGSATSQGDAVGSKKYEFSTNGSNFGAQVQYGIAEKFSLGIGLETGTTVLTPKENGIFLVNPSLSLFKFNLSGRYYLLNEEKFNIYAGPSIGYTSGKDKTIYYPGDNSSTKFSGLNYGINAGGNYYLSETVGVNLNLGYEANSLKGTTTEVGYPDQTGKVSIGGINIMAGLALKF